MKHSIREIKLSTGSQGLLVNVPGSTIVNMEFTFLSGYEFVDKSKYEVPHSVEHMIFGANKYYKNSREFSREFGLNGALHNAYTDNLLNGYYAETADFEWERIMKLFWQGLTTPRFLASEFKTEQETIVEELSSRLMHYPLTLNIALEQAMGDDRTLDYQTRLDLLPNIKPRDLHIHYANSHQAPNMRFIVAADLDDKREDMLKLLERYTNRLPEGERHTIKPMSLIKPDEPIAIIKDVDKLFFALRMASEGELTERELLALEFISYTLTGAWDSRIFGKGREKGLLYGIHTVGGNYSGVSSMTLFGSVIPAKADDLIKFISSELSKFIREGMSEDELKSAKQNALGSFQIRYQTLQHLVNWYSRYFMYDDFYSFTDRSDLIKSITRNDVQRVVHKIMHNDEWAVGFLGRKTHISKAQKHYEAISKVWEH